MASSTVSTPGPDFPGAYPDGPDDNATTATTTTTTTTQYQSDVSSALLNAKSYLPQSVQSYFPGPNTAENPPILDIVDTVPQVPEAVDARILPATAATPDHSIPTLHSLPPHRPDSFSNLSTTAQDGSLASRSDSFSTLAPSTTHTPHLSGNDSPPVKVEAVLHEPYPHLSPRQHPLSGQGAHLPNGVSLNPASAPPALEPLKSTPIGTQSPTRVTSSTMADTGHERPIDDAASPESSTRTLDSGSRFKEQDEASLTQTTTAHTRSSGSDVSSSGSPKHRHRFMNKIKGEVKIISGKLGNNEEKIEEGREQIRNA